MYDWQAIKNSGSGGLGSSGYSGFSGRSGFSGTNGTNGTGTTGSSGFSGYSGGSGFSGYSGKSGFSGYSGMFGGDSMPFKFDATNTATPASGYIALNNTTYSAATGIFVSFTNSDAVSTTNWVVSFDDSTNNPHGFLRIVKQGDSSKFIDYSIGTVATTDDALSIGVTYVTGNGTISANDAIILTFSRTGDAGTSGFSGYSGRSGFSGYSGAAGSTGSTGSSGFSGYSGISGFSGYSGISGANGSAGASGFSGYSGISGFSGYSGISGFSGYSGTSGFSGYSGISGFSGYSGKSGFSGYSGVPAGSTTQVQFNDSSAFGGDADLVWDKTNNVLNIAQSTASTKGQLSVNASNTLPAILLTGGSADATSDSTGGVALYMTHNGSGNRQFVIGASDNYNSSTASVFRYLTGASIATIDGITGNGGTRCPVNLGTDTSSVAIGNNSLAYNASLSGKLSVYQESGKAAIWATNVSGATDPLVSLDASVGTNSTTPFMTFTGDATAGTTMNVNTSTGSVTIQGYVRIIVNGTTRWMPYYS
jgi:collagen type IV alpha